ncbi:hypothetical protein ABKN59_006789 [Abortiporus biennis]
MEDLTVIVSITPDMSLLRFQRHLSVVIILLVTLLEVDQRKHHNIGCQTYIPCDHLFTLWTAVADARSSVVQLSMGNLSGMKLVFLLVYWKHLALGRSDELRISYMRLMQSPVSTSKKLGCRKFADFTVGSSIEFSMKMVKLLTGELSLLPIYALCKEHRRKYGTLTSLYSTLMLARSHSFRLQYFTGVTWLLQVFNYHTCLFGRRYYWLVD